MLRKFLASKWILSIYLVLHLRFITIVAKKCERQYQCNINPNVQLSCGICVEDKSKQGVCIYPFKYYRPSENCLLDTNCLGNNRCNHQGLCKKGEEIFICECKKGRYGDTCEHRTPPQLIKVIPTIIDYGMVTIIELYEYNTQSLRFSCESKDTSIRFHSELTTPFEYTGVQRGVSSSCIKWSQNARKPYVDVKMTFRFPYVKIDDKSQMPRVEMKELNGEILGYLTSFEVQLKVDKTTVSKRKVDVFVLYRNDLHCFPIIDIPDCAHSQKKIPYYIRSDEISFTSYVRLIAYGKKRSSCPRCCEDSSGKDVQPLITWRVWKNRQSDGDSTIREEYEKKDLLFKPFSLTHGSYTIAFDATVAEFIGSKNFAYCYFRIRLEPLVAVLEGSIERTVNIVDGITLDAGRSKDPNQPYDKQTSLYTTWNCFKSSDKSRQDICKNKTLPPSEIYVIPREKLVLGEEYNIKLTLWTNLYDFKTVKPVRVDTKVKVLDDLVEITCLINCEGDVITTEPLLLEVNGFQALNDSKKNRYEWTFNEKGETKDKNISLIGSTVEGTQSAMLMVRKYALDKGKIYVIKVKSLKSNLTAKYFVETEAKVDGNGSCSINPEFGIRGVTLFDIVCENFTSPHNSLTFEFYDKYPEEDTDITFNGRMMGTSPVGKLEGVRLTRGRVLVYIFSQKRLITFDRFIVNLTKHEITQKFVDDMLNDMTQNLGIYPKEKVLRYISVLSDIVPDNLDKSVVLGKIISAITSFSANTLASMKLTTSAMYVVLISFNKPKKLMMNPEQVRDILKTMYYETKLFRDIVGLSQSMCGMTPTDVKEIAKCQLNCIHSTLSFRDPKTVAVSEFDYDSESLYALMESSNLIEETIFLLEDILTFLQAPGEPPTKMESTNNLTVMWVVKNSKFKLTFYLGEGNRQGIPVDISEASLRVFQEKADAEKGQFALRVATIKDDIFWWRQSDVKSNFIAISPVIQLKRPNIMKVESQNAYLSLFVNLNPSVKSAKISGVIPKLNTSNVTFDQNKAVLVYRLDPEPQSILSLRFLFPQTNGTLRVIVTNYMYPTYDVLTSSKAQIIQKENSFYLFGPSTEFVQQKDNFLYVGILPQNLDQEVSFTYEVNTTLCKKWIKGQWSAKGCGKTHKNDLEVTCKCNKFSIYAAAFPVPPRELDLFEDIKLFTDVRNNPYVVSFVAVFLLSYFILCIWVRCKDISERTLRHVNILDDNFPGDSSPYLVAVYTSPRFNAGTTAHVGIKLFGRSLHSRAHILSSKYKNVLKSNCDDWFLIFCPQHLGMLESISIWHDNAGHHPDWYVSRITVYDLTYNIQYIFIVDQWLALHVNEYTEATVIPATEVEVRSVKRLFIENCIFGFRESHPFLAIFFRQSRSEITRVQRVSIYMCLLMVAMLCSIMFYFPEEEGVDFGHYGIRMEDLYVTIECLCITTILTSLVLMAFKKSNKYRSRNVRVRSIIQFTDKKYSLDDSTVTEGQKRTQGRCERFLTKSLKERPLIPAQLPRSEPVLIVRKKWLVLAWVSCVTVISLSSFFVMLYGLKLGKVASLKWLSLVLMTVAGDVCIVGPAKIVSIAVLLSVVSLQMCGEETHSVTAEDVKKVKVPDDEKSIISVLMRRHHPMYCSLTTDVKHEMMKRRLEKDKWWALLDFITALMFVCIVSALVFKLWSSHYYTNSHIVKLMTGPHHASLHLQEFFAIKRIDQMEDYLKNSFIFSLYNTFWYNKMPLGRKGSKIYYAEDYIYTNFGLQQLRQLRVAPKQCELEYVKTEKKCIPHLSESEETGDFDVGWQELEFPDVQTENWPWRYEQNTKSRWFTMYRLFGASGRIFGDGGYKALLGPMKDNIQLTMLELTEDHWQNVLTRAVIVEFTLYNGNVDVFSQVTMIVDYLIAGDIRQNIHVTTVETGMRWELWNGLFFVFVLYYIIKSVNAINRNGLMYCLRSYLSRSQLHVVILGCSSIAVAIVHFYTSTSYYEKFIQSGKLTYFDFDTFVFYFLILQFLLSVLLAVAMFRTIFLFRGGRGLLNYMYTLSITTNWVICLILVTLLFILIQFHLFIQLNIFSMDIKGILLDHKSFRYFEVEEYNKTHIRVLFFVKMVSVAVVAGLFIVIFKHHLKIARKHKLKYSDDFNLVTFFVSRLRRKLSNFHKN